MSPKAAARFKITGICPPVRGAVVAELVRTHRSPVWLVVTDEIREAAEQELRALTGEYFGYAFDLPRAAREAARARWQSWWTERRTKPSG